ncbi:MAG TPA: AAA domain-containing protein, partial [Actinoplanes sp.]|nr:AAA domain-containing protein [Actinoplanes sp.]
VEHLADRLTRVHRGLRKLFSAYRRDYEAVASFALPSVSPSEAVAHLGLAVAWRAARRDLAALEREHGPALGRYWRGATSDFAALGEAVQAADDLLRWTPPQAVPAVIDHVCAPRPDDGLLRAAAGVQAAVSRWQAALRPVPEPAARPELAHGAVRDAIGWLRAGAAPLSAAARYVSAHDEATGKTLDLAGARRLAALRQAVAEAMRELPSAARDVDERAEAVAIDWAERARELAGRALTADQAAALAGCRPSPGLAEKAAAWAIARGAVVAAFGTARRASLEAELDDYERGPALLRALREDSSGQEEWFSHVAAREVLAGFGLDPAVAFCADTQVLPSQLRPVLERALLRAWADDVLHRDRRLHPLRSQERDHLVGEFRRRDEELIAAAPAHIAAALHARRAEGVPADEAALLRREGMKETRHLAVRELIGRCRTAVLAMKPCFLMSPLAVSQYLPADIGFDVVIFDEASQVTPANAINCIYRGTTLIAAGDDKQLPPTSFFEAVADGGTDVSDFQSILELAKACGAFPSLGLAWHYRSRHESLIAFANQAFYQGRLITFPAAADRPDTGVHLIEAGGAYRRGSTRDNPVEAGIVAERVIASLTTRPDLSLGVVTFSVAQAEAIEYALSEAVAHHPGLDRLLDGDRLHGFFVKSLEAVQGDERDIMIFSIGYGHDEHGRISANFGALSRPNGWRRLNVAITRARQRVEIVSSIRSHDIPETGNESVRHLAAYLSYCENGGAAGRLDRTPLGPLEESVRATLESWGYEVRARIGSGGYRIDLGVLRGGSYLLGIECDGAMYHGCPVARDRDRLRAAVLRDLGWNLYRVWGAAWYRDRAEEEARLRAAIERAALPGRGPSRRPDLLQLLPVS